MDAADRAAVGGSLNEPTTVTVRLKPGIWMIHVAEDGHVRWIETTHKLLDPALPLDEAAQRWFYPALAQLRQMVES